MALTKQNIIALPLDVETEITDPDCSGLRIRVRNGRKAWTWVGRSQGKMVRQSLGAFPDVGVKEARLKADELRTTLQRQAVSQPNRQAVVTFDGLADRFLVKYATTHRPNSVSAVTKAIRKARRVFGPRMVSTITRGELIEFLEAIAAEGHGPMANSTCSALRGCFKFGVTRSLISVNPLDGYAERPGGADIPKDRVLSADEVGRFWRTVDKLYTSAGAKTALRLVLLTAQRPGEVCGMTVEELDIDAGRWVIPAARMKNKKPHTVLLSEPAKGLLRSLDLPATGRLFYTAKGRPLDTKALGEVVRLQEWPLDIFTPHDLRRTSATGMRACGCAASDVGAYLSHSDGGGITSRVYALDPVQAEAKTRAVAALNSWLFLAGIEDGTEHVSSANT